MAVAYIDFYLVASSGEIHQLLPQRSYLFGRGEDVDFLVQDTLTSRHHCELRWDDESFWSLADLKSRNGTYVNGKKVADAAKLNDRDVLQVGGQQFTYHLLPPGSDVASLTKKDGASIKSMETFEVAASDVGGGAGGPSFTGQLRDQGLKELLRFFNLTKKSGRLMLAHSLAKQIWIDGGVPRHAMNGAERGMPAAKSLMQITDGAFSFHEGEAAEKWSIEGDAATVLKDLIGASDLDDLGIDGADLAKAESLQRHLMARIPKVPGYDLGVFFQGRSGISGDVYDVGVMADGKVLVVLGDVAGHGVQAAMVVTGMLKSLRSLRRTHTDLVSLLAALNDEVKEDLLPGQFLTLFAATLKPATGELTVALCGHHPGYLFTRDGSRPPTSLGQPGMALGIAAGKTFGPRLKTQTVTLQPGDAIVQYTDGVLEAMDKENEEFGDERLKTSLAKYASSPAVQAIVDGVAVDVKAFAAKIEDDLTVLCVARTDEIVPETIDDADTMVGRGARSTNDSDTAHLSAEEAARLRGGVDAEIAATARPGKPAMTEVVAKRVAPTGGATEAVRAQARSMVAAQLASPAAKAPAKPPAKPVAPGAKPAASPAKTNGTARAAKPPAPGAKPPAGAAGSTALAPAAKPPAAPAVAGAAAGDPWIGRALGSVKLVCRIGGGAMGAVYRGHHEVLDTDVAVKVMLPKADAKTDEHARKRFLQEARTAARIRHPNVLQVLDAGATDDGATYLVIELVEGMSLGRRLDDHGKMTPGELLGIAKPIAEGLAAVHATGVIHRDIKPDNILLDPRGVPKISDLGMARSVDDTDAQRLTMTGVIIGTPAYISPEAVEDSRQAGPKSDVYSLGVTFYHLLAGRPPYVGDTAYQVMMAHMEGSYEPLRKLVPDLPKQLGSVIERCLAKDPAQRPSAEELAALLGMAGSSASTSSAVGVHQTAVPSFLRKPTEAQKRRKMGVVVGAGVAVAIAIAAGAWFFLHH